MIESLTMKKLMSWHPCYDYKKVEELFDVRRFVTWEDVRTAKIPIRDKWWVLCHLFDEGAVRADLAELLIVQVKSTEPCTSFLLRSFDGPVNTFVSMQIATMRREGAISTCALYTLGVDIQSYCLGPDPLEALVKCESLLKKF